MGNKATPISAASEQALRNSGAPLSNSGVVLQQTPSAYKGVFIGKPPSVVQHRVWWCWAAATESWLKLVNRFPDKSSQAELVEVFATDPSSGALSPECDPEDQEKGCFPKFALAFGMQYEDKVIDQIRVDFLISKMRGKGPLIVLFNVRMQTSDSEENDSDEENEEENEEEEDDTEAEVEPAGGFPSHAVVVYSVQQGQDGKAVVSFMDPTNGKLKNLSMGEFHELLAGPGTVKQPTRPRWIKFVEDRDGRKTKKIAVRARVAWLN